MLPLVGQRAPAGVGAEGAQGAGEGQRAGEDERLLGEDGGGDPEDGRDRGRDDDHAGAQATAHVVEHRLQAHEGAAVAGHRRGQLDRIDVGQPDPLGGAGVDLPAELGAEVLPRPPDLCGPALLVTGEELAPEPVDRLGACRGGVAAHHPRLHDPGRAEEAAAAVVDVQQAGVVLGEGQLHGVALDADLRRGLGERPAVVAGTGQAGSVAGRRDLGGPPQDLVRGTGIELLAHGTILPAAVAPSLSAVPVQLLTSLDGEIAFDLDPEVAPSAAGPTRIADDVAADHAVLLARAATAMLATYGERRGGAAAAIRPRLLDTRQQTGQRWCDEVAPLVESERFVPLERSDPDGEARARAVVAAATAWLGDLAGRTLALGGFDRTARAVAREAVRRGARVVAVATDRGAVARAEGFDPTELDEVRAAHGASFVHHLGLDVHPAREVHELRVDVLVPAPAVGVLDHEVAPRVQARVVVPAHLVPCTGRGLDALREARVALLPDIVCAGGALLAHQTSPALTPAEALTRVEREVGERITAARLAKVEPVRHATLLADTFLATWVPADRRPDGPAVAR